MTGRVDHTRTGQWVIAGIWIDALIVMASSAYNGGWAFDELGQPMAAGIALGCAVDVGLAVALIGDRALHLAGRVSQWGRALRIITASMSLALNCAVAIAQGHWGVAAFHAFLPILLVVLTEYGQDLTLSFHAIADEAERERREREAEAQRLEREQRDAELARIEAEEARQRAAEYKETAASLNPGAANSSRVAPPAQPRKPRRDEVGKARDTRITAEATDYVLTEWRAGRRVTGAELDRRTGRNGWGRTFLTRLRREHPGAEPAEGKAS